MARNQRDGSPSTEQEISGLKDGGDAAASAAARSRAASWTTWQGLRDPRVVRVSRAFGGKDRHSKVSTVRGLRDRRVRLSVQTAIQLYDLQDRLGLNQPSKVVDWLLDTTQHEIDKLPPLQIPSGSCLFQYYPPAPPPTDAGAGGTAPLGQFGRLPAESGRPPPPVSASAGADYIMGEMGIKGDGSDHHQQMPSIMVTDQYPGAADPVIPIHGNLHRLGFLSLPSGGNLPAASYCLQLEASSNVFAPLHMDGYSTSLQLQAEEETGYRPGCPSPPAPSLSLSHAPAQLLLSSSEAEAEAEAAAAAPSKFPPYYEPRHAYGGGAALQMTGFSGSWQGSKQNHCI